MSKGKGKKEPTVPARLLKRTATKLAEIAEATDESVPEIAERLLQPGLDSEWGAVQTQLKKIRESKEKARASLGGPRKSPAG